MSAVNILVQPTAGAVHVMTDGLSYDEYGTIIKVGAKCHAIPNAKCAISSMGAGSASFVFAVELGQRFQSFDDIVANAEESFPVIHEQYRELFERVGFSEIELHVSGWSDARSQPESYMMQMRNPDSDQYWDEVYSGSTMKNAPFTIQPVTGLCGNPDLSVDEFVQAGYVVHGTTEAEIVANTDPVVDLLHTLEIQRRRKASRPGFPEHHCVGGFALLTTITADNITQKVVHRWTEDRVGELVTPKPIDWKAWRAARKAGEASAALAGVDMKGMSRLKREMLERKARKGTLKVV